jgi:hypothetical protein
MKRITKIAIGLTLISAVLSTARARADDMPMPPTEVAQFDACSALFNWQSTNPTCNAIKAQMASGHLVSEAQYKDYCEMAAKYLKDAEAAAAEYQKLAHKKVQINECPPSAMLAH